MLPSYDLTRAAWIPTRGAGGALSVLGLREVLGRAHELTAVEHPIPIVEAGLLRLLVTVVFDALRLTTLNDLLTVVRAGRFDLQRLDHYFERHDRAFDLFSPRRPFLQDAAAGGEEKPVAALLPSRPSGTNVTHWLHGHEDDFAVTPAEAATLLATVAPFMTAGGAGLSPSINGAPPWYVIPEGPTLFHTLAINLWVDRHSDVELGEPAWRRTTPINVKSRRTSATLLESLTWQPRRIRLLPGAGGRSSLSGEESPILVRRMHFVAGESCALDDWTDPHVAYVYRGKQRTPLRPVEDREPWRDVAALLVLPDRRDGAAKGKLVQLRPTIISQLAELSERGADAVGEELRLRLYGMRTDLRMKAFEWVAQPLALPVPLLINRFLQIRLVHAVEEAERVQETLASALRQAIQVSGYQSTTRRRAVVSKAARTYWSGLEERFLWLAHRLGQLDAERDATAVEVAMGEWWRALAHAAHGAFDGVVAALRLDGAHLIAVEQGRTRLTRVLAQLRGRPSAA